MFELQTSVYHNRRKLQVKIPEVQMTSGIKTYLRTNRMPKVSGPQWQETVQPAFVSTTSSK